MLCEEIKNHELAIKNYKLKIVEIKKVKACQSCGHEMDTSTIFALNVELSKK